MGGLEPGDQVIVNPIDSIANGQKVAITPAVKAADAAKPVAQDKK